MVSPSTDTLCHQQQEQQNEQQCAEDSCTSGSKVSGGMMRYASACCSIGSDKRICDICAQQSLGSIL